VKYSRWADGLQSSWPPGLLRAPCKAAVRGL
jgi:hypothetical protein